MSRPCFFLLLQKRAILIPYIILRADLIRLWLMMFRDAEQGDQVLKESQAKRLKAKNEGSKNSDRMGKVLFGAYGKETFSKFFKAMA